VNGMHRGRNPISPAAVVCVSLSLPFVTISCLIRVVVLSGGGGGEQREVAAASGWRSRNVHPPPFEQQNRLQAEAPHRREHHPGCQLMHSAQRERPCVRFAADCWLTQQTDSRHATWMPRGWHVTTRTAGSLPQAVGRQLRCFRRSRATLGLHFLSVYFFRYRLLPSGGAGFAMNFCNPQGYSFLLVFNLCSAPYPDSVAKPFCQQMQPQLAPPPLCRGTTPVNGMHRGRNPISPAAVVCVSLSLPFVTISCLIRPAVPKCIPPTVPATPPFQQQNRLQAEAPHRREHHPGCQLMHSAQRERPCIRFAADCWLTQQTDSRHATWMQICRAAGM
jgi:hypothetical protein